MTEPSAIKDDAPSPWWPCPECGEIRFRTTCVFERGRWADDTSTYVRSDPPDGRPCGIALNVTCTACDHELDIAAHYGWPTITEE